MFLKAKVISINNDRAAVSLNDGQSLTLPVSAIEGKIVPGSDVVIVAAAMGSEEAGREKLAQDLLNELIKT